MIGEDEISVEATTTSTAVLQGSVEETSATTITAIAEPTTLSLDHELDTTIAEVAPVQTRFELLLENFIHNIDTPLYQEEVSAMRSLQRVSSELTIWEHNILADIMHFKFKDR